MVNRGSLRSFTLLNFLTLFIVVNCNTSCPNYHHCEFHPGHKLDCFSRWGSHSKKEWRCEQQPGTGTSKKTYTLIIQQETYCTRLGQNEKIQIFENKNMTAMAVENPESQNCTKVIFKGTPKNLFRCGPPVVASFYRHSGILDVKVGWLKHDNKLIQGYTVRYRPMGELSWEISDGKGSREIRLNSNWTYVVEIKCISNSKCSQCPWSAPYIIPPELKMQPILTGLKEMEHPVAKGSCLVSLTWKTVEIERPDGYFVSIHKASGEPPSEHFNTTDTEIRLHLSCSVYTVNISGFNNVSVSPALSQTIKSCDSIPRMDTERLNVTVHSNISFTVHWEPQLLNNYVCYSVEWNQKNQHRAAYLSFFENTWSNWTLNFTEPLEPYKRYSLSLHTRPNRETCNLKHINSSESTFGSKYFYYMEGSPISAPTNISCYNVTSSSVVLQWSQIPEEDLRGFLLGYNIYYKEYNNRNTRTAEKVVSVDADLTSYVIEELKSGTRYQVNISGVTQAGKGVRSITCFFKTYKPVYMKDNVIIVVFVTTIVLLIVACPALKRSKAILWPSIPNPENSNAIQKIEKSCEIELLDSLQTLKVEEWHTNSLQIIEESALRVSLLNLFAVETKEDSGLMAPEQIQEDPIKDIILDQPANLEMTGLPNTQTAFTCGYTTLEIFQQTVKFQCSPTSSQEARDELHNMSEIKPVLDYVGQFCSSPTFDLCTRL
ncbi:hypothetical protein NL108_009214 [Boleophthalmus pectinirostris]|uniref:interleukin-31 receptor subunit alpha isoform X2 n=1 Tax=Boleophthalmus pectinirostris TaxID=150288 RepID=UPI000A1C69B2|nr:interleukin-31 receptor subunit alpha isoform X2 [Boleophthalmus pectinirostris]KAJ0057486.1 hypothetical protein NL108_009214 [Boleophthalmus pectinirostris]